MLTALLTILLLQSAPPPVGVEVYRSEKGLNANALYGVLVDPNGFVWVHTDNGLYRYDGNSFKAAPSTLGRDVVLADLVDETTIAALSFDNSIDLIDIRRFSDSRLLSIPDSIRLNSFASTVKRFGDTLYVGTSERRVLRQVGEEWTNFTAISNRHFIERFIDVNAVDGDMVITSTVGTWQIRDSELIPRDTSFQLTSKSSMKGHEKWIAGRNRLYAYRGQRYEPAMTLSELGIDGFVHQVLWRSEDELWIATRTKGLIVATRTNDNRFQTRQLLPHNEISGLAMDRSGSVWVSTLQHGLYKFNAWFDRYAWVRPIEQVADSKMLLATERYWITEFDGSFYRPGSGGPWSRLTDEAIYYADVVRDDAVIIGQLQSTRIHREGRFDENLQEIAKQRRLSLQPPIKHADMSDGLVAVASPNGVFLFDTDSSDLKRIFPNRATAALVLDSNTIAIGRPHQLELRSLDSGDLIYSNQIPVTTLLKLNSKAFLVAGTSNGLHVFDREDMALRPVFQDRQSVNATWERLYQLTDSTVAAVGSLGLFVLSFDRHQSLRRIVEVPLSPFGFAQNVRHVRLENDGMVWISTSSGVLQTRYEDMLSPIPPLFFTVSEIRVDGIEQIIRPEYEIESNQNRLSIQLAKLGYTNPNLVVLEYHNSADSDSTWITLSQPSIEIESIRKGLSSFEFRLRNVLTDEVLSSVSVVVRKQPHWWETTWVIVFGILLAVMATVGVTTLFQRRFHQRKLDEVAQQNRVRELERVAITRLLTSHYLFNALATIRSVARRSTDEVNWYIGRLSKVIRALIDRTSQNEVDLESELDWIRDYVALESVGRQLPIELKVDIEDNLDPTELYIPAFILQPIVENAMFHGAMTEDPAIRCDIRKIDDRLHITIRNRIDAGSISNGDRPATSKGLQFVAERLRGWGRYHGFELETGDVLSVGQTANEWATEIKLPFINHDVPLVNRT